MNRKLECGSELSSRKQADANVPRDVNAQVLGDLQRLLMANRKAGVAVVREGAGLAGC